ncbi:MAG: PQQ-dependent sugar dehydrogenase [Planctomycetes bacterium]|nr:PQQ-dependent sugar dehydrogenase [Planctomycetota bacterium]
MIRALAAGMWLAASAAALPPGLVDEPILGGWTRAVGVVAGPDGRLFVWEKGGRVWTVEQGVKSAAPLIDIHDEVRDFGDYGMLGLALDPQFASNGRIYLLYAVDYDDLVNMDKPGYNPAGSQSQRDSIGRITRYTLNASDGFRSIVPNSRRVLLGESPSTGFPLIYQSHGIGSLAFGEDGSLLAGSGDSANFNGIDTGGPQVGSSNTALADGIIKPKEDIGAFRAQLVDSLAGKIIRISAETGDGLPDNPFYDAAHPRAARSRVWTLGVRNPFRFGVRPQSATAGNPVGAIFAGDVGFESHEELDVFDAPGQNGGWPLYEGLSDTPGYSTVVSPPNQDAPNPRAGINGCAAYFSFRDLLAPDGLGPAQWSNPCDPSQQVPASIPAFRVKRPVIAWGHGGSTLVPVYSGNDAAAVPIDDPGSPVSGFALAGTCVVGGAWCMGQGLGSAYASTYFAGDFTGKFIVNMSFDAANRLLEVRPFLESPTPIAHIAISPMDASLYYIAYSYNGPGTLRRIRRVSCPCDLTGDGVVDDADFVAFIPAYNTLECGPVCPADFNGDDRVDDADFELFVVAYNALICS